jgi:hypothetical protein
VSRGPSLPLVGGLDLTSPGPMTRPGTLADCENYEVSTRSGYTRISGVERFDGRPGVAEHRLLMLTVAGVVGALSVRAAVQFVVGGSPLDHQGVVGYILQVTETTVTVAFAGGMADPSLPDTLETVVAGATATVTAFQSLKIPNGQQQDYDYALKQLADARRAEIETVPGRAGSDILGGFLLRDKNYAIRDLPRKFFEGGYYTDADEGDYITIDGLQYQILEARVLGDNAGYVAYDPIPGTGTAAVGVGTPVLVDLPISGALSPALTGIPYADGLVVSGGVPPYVWSLAEDDVGPPAPSEISDLSEITFQSEVTPAALWRSSSTGWDRVDLGREMPFRSGTDGLASTPRSLAVDVGDVKASALTFPGTVELNGAALANLTSDNGVTGALTSAAVQSLYCSNFDFSAIPVGAEIVGIELVIERQSTAGGKAKDGVVVLTSVFGGTENKASGEWPDALTVKTYGSSSDLWASENLTRDVLQDPSFGAVFVVDRSVPANPITATIDYVAIRVHYVERGGRPVYLWNGTTDVPATVLNVQILSGDSGASSAAGYVTLTAAKNTDKPRLVVDGDQIRTAAAGGGTLIGVVAGRDRPIFLPGQSEMDNNRSQYQWHQYNFFGQDRYSAMYGVSGAGPALSFDGETLIKVRTPLAPDIDIPRHIAKHGTMLALGYFSGAVILSSVGAPYEMRGDFGATPVEVGDRLTALAPAGGDALLIVCETSTYVLRGLSPQAFSQQTVSSQRGAIEYTLADPGRAIISDSFGLFAADTPESFESASRAYMSASVQPWLRERLQATISNEQRFNRVVRALPVRSKNQYRLYFRDGAILTMTMTDAGVETTKQRLYVAGTPDIPLAVRSVWSGIDASGRERLFATFNGTKEGYVFEMDVGRSLDGEEIAAYMIINPFYAGAITQLKQFDRCGFGGAGGYANLLVTYGINSQLPSGGTRPAQLGFPQHPATSENGSVRNDKIGSFDVGIEGYNILIRVDSLTADEAPHTLQFIETFINPRGESRGHKGDA